MWSDFAFLFGGDTGVDGSSTEVWSGPVEKVLLCDCGVEVTSSEISRLGLQFTAERISTVYAPNHASGRDVFRRCCRLLYRCSQRVQQNIGSLEWGRSQLGNHMDETYLSIEFVSLPVEVTVSLIFAII